MSKLTSLSESSKIQCHQVRDLIAALASEVVWPFRWRVAVILLMQIVSQVMLLVSLVIPWQLLQVLITGQSRIDNWLPVSDHNEKIMLLTALALLCFVTYSLSKWATKKAIARFSVTILQNLNKTRLVPNHRVLGKHVLGVVIGTLSSIVIASLFCLVLALLHPLLALLAIICILALIMTVMFYYRLERVQKLQEILQGNVLTVINISFVLGFLIIVLDNINGTMRPLFTLFILLLAMRQLMAASVNGLVGFLSIIKYVRQINMLLLPRSRQISLFSVSNFIGRFEQATLKQWLLPWLIESGHCQHVPEILQCRFLNGRGVAHVLIRDAHVNGASRYILLKCYVSARENEALHETALLNEVSGYYNGTFLIVPVLLKSGHWSWCSFVLLHIGNELPQWKNSEERKPWMSQVRQCLLHIPLSDSLIAQYSATFASLPERMKNVEASYFAYLTEQDKQNFQVEHFMRLWPLMLSEVEKIPKCKTLDNLNSARMADIGGHALLIDWHGWVYDTVGAYWPLSARLQTEILEMISSQWDHLSTQHAWASFATPVIASHYAALAARAHEFCQRCRANNDVGALNMMAGLIKAYEMAKASD